MIKGHNVVKFIILCLLLIATACSKDEQAESNDESVLVRVMFNPAGLGDLSYNDNILKGILQKQKELNFRLQYVCPEDEKEETELIRYWQQEAVVNKQYVVLVGDQLRTPALEISPAATVRDYLLCDMDLKDSHAPIFRFCGYGVSFLAGIAAHAVTGSDSAVYIAAKPDDNYLEDAYKGFRDGFLYAGGKKVPQLFVATGSDGFNNPTRGYALADSLFRLYPFIYAMAGGTNTGVYKYLRDHPGLKCYTAGVDADQSIYSDRIIGSMIKDVGGCTGEYIERWMRGEEIPMWQYVDLRSEFIYFQVSEGYRSRLEHLIDEKEQVAIEKEIKYVREYR